MGHFFDPMFRSKQRVVNHVEDQICYLCEWVLIEAHKGCLIMHAAPALCGCVNWALSGASVWDGCTMSQFKPGCRALSEGHSRINKIGTDHSACQMAAAWNILLQPTVQFVRTHLRPRLHSSDSPLYLTFQKSFLKALPSIQVTFSASSLPPGTHVSSRRCAADLRCVRAAHPPPPPPPLRGCATPL